MKILRDATLFYLEDGEERFLRLVGFPLSNYMTSRPHATLHTYSVTKI